ncbi:MAG: GNAT family N-acetyltransferase [Sporichthyaceae bacterium]|nr:GNAT family N-acetyltransferase [Sporichthyaceae bacterium]
MDGSGLADGVIQLRGWRPSDADWYAQIAAADPLIQRFTSESPTVTAAQVRTAITELAGRADAAGFVICDSDTGNRLGNIALDHEDGIGHVSYWLAADARGRGAATRALRLFAAWAFESLELTELRLWTHPDNIGSRRVAERAGFRRDPDRDHPRQVKGATWPTVSYALPAPNRPQISSTSAP